MSQAAQDAITKKCEELAALLRKKNEAYGNSAFEKSSTFARTDDVLELIRIRMDDKLSRIRNARDNDFNDDEDPYWDLAGYLILYLIARDNPEAIQ